MSGHVEPVAAIGRDDQGRPARLVFPTTPRERIPVRAAGRLGGVTVGHVDPTGRVDWIGPNAGRDFVEYCGITEAHASASRTPNLALRAVVCDGAPVAVVVETDPKVIGRRLDRKYATPPIATTPEPTPAPERPRRSPKVWS